MSSCCSFKSCPDIPFKLGLCQQHYTAIRSELRSDTPATVEGKSSSVTPSPLKTALYIFNRFTDTVIRRYRGIFELGTNDLLSIHLDEVKHQVKGGSPDKAAESLHRAATLSPDNPKISLHLGDLHFREGNFEQALSCYRSVLQNEPECELIHEKIADTLFGLGRHEEAIEHIRQAIHSAPERPDAYYRLGIALEAAGRIQDAVGPYEEAVERAPTSARYIQALGFAYESVGRHDKALACFKQALSIES